MTKNLTWLSLIFEGTKKKWLFFLSLSLFLDKATAWAIQHARESEIKYFLSSST